MSPKIRITPCVYVTMVDFSQPIHHYCADYPVLNYTLVMNNTLNPADSQSHALSPENPVTVDTLLENSVYVVKIVAANVVGEVSTQYRELCESATSLH